RTFAGSTPSSVWKNATERDRSDTFNEMWNFTGSLTSLLLFGGSKLVELISIAGRSQRSSNVPRVRAASALARSHLPERVACLIEQTNRVRGNRHRHRSTLRLPKEPRVHPSPGSLVCTSEPPSPASGRGQRHWRPMNPAD